MKLVYIFRILYRRRWIILGCFFLAIVTAFLLTSNLQKTYKSNAQLSTGFTVTADLRLTDEIFNLSQIDVKFNNAIADLTSAKMISLLSYNLVLHDLQGNEPFRTISSSMLASKPQLKSISKEQAIRQFTNKKDSILILNPGIPAEKNLIDFLDAYGYSINAIRNTLSVGRQQRTDYINIGFRSENPELSSFAVNTFCTEFQRYNDAFSRQRSIESSVVLDSLLRKRKQDLDNKVAAKSKFVADSVSSSLDPNMVGVNILGQIGQAESGLADEMAKVQDLTYQISQINQQLQKGGGTTAATSGETNAPKTGDNSEWLALRKQFYDMRREYLNNISSDPDVKKRLDDLEARMNAAAPPVNGGGASDPNSPVNINGLTDRKINLEGQLRAANYKINGYRSKISELNGKLRNASPASAAAMERYDKEIEAAQTEYDLVKVKLNQASDMGDAFVQKYRQTLFGQPALAPEPSHRMVTMALSGLSAAILSSLVFIFIAYIDQSIKTPSQFSHQTGLKLLGTVNMINLKHGSLAEQVTHIAQEEAKRDNSFRELLRKLRYEIEKSGKRIILFTSTEPQQGKTTLTQALAFSLHLGRKKVLIMDTNFCNNDLTVLNNAKPTLEQFSSAGELGDNEISGIVTKTVVDCVDIIGCKGGDYTPSEILPRNHLLNHLPELLKRYDYIFMEAAPLNGFTDTRELVQYVDGVIAIFSATAEVKQSDRESIKFLREMKDKFIGAILNKVNRTDINQ